MKIDTDFTGALSSTDNSANDAVRLLPLAVALWMGYLLALLLIDHTFYPTPIFSPAYYLISGFNALVVLGLALYPPLRDRFGRALVPLAILLLSVGSVALAELTGTSPRSPASSPESILIRTMPLLLLALILTAWQYGWPYVIVYSGGVALFSLGLYSWLAQGGRPFGPPVTLVTIQTISFLVVGYFISALVKRLKNQQESLIQANAQLSHYAATLEELTISRERNRMARELHDTLAHTLSALSVQLETVKAYWDVDPLAAQQMLDKSLSATRSGLQETRRALKSLRAAPLDDLGLALALRRMAEQTAARANLALDLSLPADPLSLSAGVEQAIYRIAQEALANAAHHANARTLTVELSTTASTSSGQAGVSLVISDDGIGFDPQQAQTAGHFGLSGMKERAALVGGDLTVTSQPGQGTSVVLKMAAD